MAETIIDKEKYGQGKIGCAPLESIKKGFFYVERRKLCQQPDDAIFARELFVKIIYKRDKGGWAEVLLRELSDDGRELPVSDKKVSVANDGVILKPELDADPERGYLIGGTAPPKDGFNLTKEELFEPAFVSQEVRADQATAALPLPE